MRKCVLVVVLLFAVLTMASTALAGGCASCGWLMSSTSSTGK